MSFPRVVVTGVGAITPIGLNATDLWASLISGKSGVDRLTAFDPARFDCKIAAEVRGYDPKAVLPPKESRRMERFCQFGVTAALEALKDSGLEMTKDPS